MPRMHVVIPGDRHHMIMPSDGHHVTFSSAIVECSVLACMLSGIFECRVLILGAEWCC